MKSDTWKGALNMWWILSTSVCVKMCEPVKPQILRPHTSLWFSGLGVSWRICTDMFQVMLIWRPHIKNYWGLPWWYSGQESASQSREHGFNPWSRKIPHGAEQLSPCTTTTEPAHLEPVPCNKRNHWNEKPSHRKDEQPLLAATRESPLVAAKTWCNQK